MEPHFVKAKIIGYLANMIAYFFIENCFKCDYEHYSTVAFGNARITCNVRMRYICKVDII